MQLVDGIVGFLTGIISGFGIGGGSLLILYLTAFRHADPRTARGVNLLYFTGCAPTALITHIKERRVFGKAVLFCLLTGLPTSILISIISQNIQVQYLQKAFGVLLLYVGIKELFVKPKQ